MGIDEDAMRTAQSEVDFWIDELVNLLRPNIHEETIDLREISDESLSEASGYAGGIHQHLEWVQEERSRQRARKDGTV